MKWTGGFAGSGSKMSGSVGVERTWRMMNGPDANNTVLKALKDTSDGVTE